MGAPAATHARTRRGFHDRSISTPGTAHHARPPEPWTYVKCRMARPAPFRDDMDAGARALAVAKDPPLDRSSTWLPRGAWKRSPGLGRQQPPLTMLIASQFLLWVAAALLLIAVLALSRQVSGLRERLEQNAVCPRCGGAAGSHVAEPH